MISRFVYKIPRFWRIFINKRFEVIFEGFPSGSIGEKFKGFFISLFPEKMVAVLLKMAWRALKRCFEGRNSNRRSAIWQQNARFKQLNSRTEL